MLSQLLGALYLGFALLNWLSKGVRMGGIYARPLAMGNGLHFLVGAFTLLRHAQRAPAAAGPWGWTAGYALLAGLFGVVVFAAPRGAARAGLVGVPPLGVTRAVLVWKRFWHPRKEAACFSPFSFQEPHPPFFAPRAPACFALQATFPAPRTSACQDCLPTGRHAWRWRTRLRSPLGPLSHLFHHRPCEGGAIRIRSIETSPQLYARLGGALYVVIIPFGACSEGFVTNNLLVAYPRWAKGTLAGSPVANQSGTFAGVGVVLAAIPWGYLMATYGYPPKAKPPPAALATGPPVQTLRWATWAAALGAAGHGQVGGVPVPKALTPPQGSGIQMQ